MEALLLFSLPYAPETVPSSASDYSRAQMLCHPLPPEMLNSKICLAWHWLPRAWRDLDLEAKIS